MKFSKDLKTNKRTLYLEEGDLLCCSYCNKDIENSYKYWKYKNLYCYRCATTLSSVTIDEVPLERIDEIQLYNEKHHGEGKYESNYN